MDGGIEELLGGFGVEAADEFGRVFEVGKEHRHLLALAFQGGTGRANFLSEVRGGIGPQFGVQRAPLDRRRCGGWRERCRPVAGPDQDIAVLIDRHPLALDEFVLQILQGRVIELELPLEGIVGQASAPLQHGHRLVEDLLKGHRQPSL